MKSNVTKLVFLALTLSSGWAHGAGGIDSALTSAQAGRPSLTCYWREPRSIEANFVKVQSLGNLQYSVKIQTGVHTLADGLIAVSPLRSTKAPIGFIGKGFDLEVQMPGLGSHNRGKAFSGTLYFEDYTQRLHNEVSCSLQ